MPKKFILRARELATFVRAHDWWSYKLGPIMGTAYGTAIILNRSLVSLWPSLLFLLTALVLGAIYTSIINNLCDAEEDHLSGKVNYMFGRSPRFIFLVLISSIVPGLIVAITLAKTPVILGVYICNWLVFTFYSIPPIRLKKRGFWGVVAIAMGESLLPQLFGVLLIANASGAVAPTVWLILIAVWSFSSGLRSIFWHQLEDLENDRLAGVNTFAVLISPKNLRRLGKWMVFPLEIAGLMGILIYSHSPLLWMFLLLYLITEWLRNYFWHIQIVIVEPSPDHRLALFEYYDVFYSLGFIVIAIFSNLIDLVVLFINITFYFKRIWWWLRDFSGLLRWEIPKYLNSGKQK